MMKHFLKNTFKIILLAVISVGVILLIGVSIPQETYKQKDEQVLNLLIKGCNVVDVINGKIVSNRNVLVQNGKIRSIDSVVYSNQKNIKIIEANGKYLMPNLWDMHIHTLSLSPQLHFPLLIANGVTNLRVMGDGDSWISKISDKSERDKIRWERQVKDEKLLMPRILQATSFHLEEVEDITKDNYKIKVTELVSKLKARGEPFIKVQLENTKIPNYIFYQIQIEAKKQGISILGHLSPNLDVGKVLDNGFKSVEHAWALIPHCVKNKKEFNKDIEQKKHDLSNQDISVSKNILLKMVSKNTYYVPTHVTSNRKEYLAFDPSFNKNPNNEYVENMQLFLWKSINWIHTKGYDKDTDLSILKNYYKRGLEITKLANQNGVKVLAGTDALDRNVYYGLSLHDELEEMVKAGLNNAEALRTATYNAAEYYGLNNQYGSIEVGKNADFMLLDQNPLENISHTKTINSVYFESRLYNEEDFKQMKIFVKKQAKSFGVTCKFIWNMIKA